MMGFTRAAGEARTQRLLPLKAGNPFLPCFFSYPLKFVQKSHLNPSRGRYFLGMVRQETRGKMVGDMKMTQKSHLSPNRMEVVLKHGTTGNEG